MLLFGFSAWVLAIELIICIVFVVAVQLEHWGFSTVVFIASLAVLHFLMDINLFVYAKENLGTIILLCLCSLAIGIIWSFIKWVSFLYSFKGKREEYLIKYHSVVKGYREISQYDYLDDKYYKNTQLSKAPLYTQYKSQIIAWVIFWIPSLIGTLLDDFVRKFVTWIVNRFSAIYQGLSEKIVGNFQKIEK